MGTEGPHDDFELTVAGGQLQITSPPSVPVVCFTSPSRASASTSSSTRSITYKVTGSSQEPGRVAGTLGMSFADSKYDVFTNTITFVNCSGSQSFEAVPAG